MKIDFNEDRKLVITSENYTENIALSQWEKEGKGSTYIPFSGTDLGLTEVEVEKLLKGVE